MAGRRRGIRRPRSTSFPTTADVGLRASAPSPEGLFEAIGTALFGLMVDRRGIRRLESRRVRASAPELGELLVAYLGELLLLEQLEGFVGRAIKVRLLGRPPRRLEATILGERLDPARHHLRTEVKAITLHRLRVRLDPPSARVIVDI